MELKTQARHRTVTIIMVASTLTALAAGLGFMIALCTSSAEAVDEEVAKRLLRLATVALVMLAFDLLMGFWLLIRLVGQRSRIRHRHEPTLYVDAWAAAGRRFRLDDGDDDNDHDHDDHDDESDDDRDEAERSGDIYYVNDEDHPDEQDPDDEDEGDDHDEHDDDSPDDDREPCG